MLRNNYKKMKSDFICRYDLNLNRVYFVLIYICIIFA